MVCHSIKTPWSDRNVHLVDPPQVMEDVDVDCALPGAAGHPVPAADAVGHQSHQIMSPAEPIPELKHQLGGRTISFNSGVWGAPDLNFPRPGSLAESVSGCLGSTIMRDPRGLFC